MAVLVKEVLHVREKRVDEVETPGRRFRVDVGYECIEEVVGQHVHVGGTG